MMMLLLIPLSSLLKTVLDWGGASHRRTTSQQKSVVFSPQCDSVSSGCPAGRGGVGRLHGGREGVSFQVDGRG